MYAKAQSNIQSSHVMSKDIGMGIHESIVVSFQLFMDSIPVCPFIFKMLFCDLIIVYVAGITKYLEFPFVAIFSHFVIPTTAYLGIRSVD